MAFQQLIKQFKNNNYSLDMIHDIANLYNLSTLDGMDNDSDDDHIPNFLYTLKINNEEEKFKQENLDKFKELLNETLISCLNCSFSKKHPIELTF